MQDIKYGRVVHRREDFRLTQGRGLYAADVAPEDTTHAVFVRSPHAHARIRAVDTAAAKEAADEQGGIASLDDRPRHLPLSGSPPGGDRAFEPHDGACSGSRRLAG